MLNVSECVWFSFVRVWLFGWFVVWWVGYTSCCSLGVVCVLECDL